MWEFWWDDGAISGNRRRYSRALGPWDVDGLVGVVQNATSDGSRSSGIKVGSEAQEVARRTGSGHLGRG